MIKNIVFDMGGVLIDWNPREYLENKGFEKESIDYIIDKVINTQDWRNIDNGTYTFNEALDIFYRNHAHMADEIKRAFVNEFEMLQLKPATSDYLKSLKSEGYHIYILSNMSVEAYEKLKAKYEYFQYSDGDVISAAIKHAKPDKEMYTYLLKEYHLLPEETIFIDDMQINLDAAEALNIKTVLFTDIDEVKNKIQMMITQFAEE